MEFSKREQLARSIPLVLRFIFERAASSRPTFQLPHSMQYGPGNAKRVMVQRVAMSSIEFHYASIDYLYAVVASCLHS